MKKSELQQALEARNRSSVGTVVVLQKRLSEVINKADKPGKEHQDISTVKLDKPLKTPSVVCAIKSGLLMVCDDALKAVMRVQVSYDGQGVNGNISMWCQYAEGCNRACDASASENAVYFCFTGDKGGIYQLPVDASLASLSMVMLNSVECTVVGVHVDHDFIYFSDTVSQQVKKIHVLTKDITIVAGCGATGTLDGKASESSFTQLRAIWGEGRVVYVTDTATGSLRMVTPLEGTITFLTNLKLLYDAFGISLKGQKPPAACMQDAISSLNKVAKFVDDCTKDVQQVIKKNAATNGPEGTISKKTQLSTRMVLDGLRRLESCIMDINPAFSELVNLQSCMTSVVENLHSVTKMKHSTPTVLDHARSFGSAMHESVKRMTVWSVKYFTHPKSYYPVPRIGMKLLEFNQAPLKPVPMKSTDMEFMRHWAKENGQPVRQMSVRQLSTMDKPGTLPISAYHTPLVVRPIEEDESPVNIEVIHETCEDEGGLGSLHEVEQADEYEEESDYEEIRDFQEEHFLDELSLVSDSRSTRSGRVIRPIFRLDL